VLIRVPASEGEPDGLTVDAEGYLWSARWNGGCIVRFSPEGREVLRVELPARKVSCLTFGGMDCQDIYISTAGGDKRDEEGPGAGALFCLNLGIRGRAEFPSRVLC
jgi:D-xylonolactonase